MEFRGSAFVMNARSPDVSECQEHRWPSPLLGNGKLTLFPSWRDDRIDSTARTRISLDGTQGVRGSVDTFRVGDVRLGSTRLEDVMYDRREASLDLYSATFMTTHDVISRTTGNHLAEVNVRTCALRQYPYCSLQVVSLTLDIDNLSDEGLDVFHGISSPPSVSKARFEASKAASLDFFSGYGSDPEVASATVCCYLWDDPLAYETLGVVENEEGESRSQNQSFHHVRVGRDLVRTLRGGASSFGTTSTNYRLSFGILSASLSTHVSDVDIYTASDLRDSCINVLSGVVYGSPRSATNVPGVFDSGAVTRESLAAVQERHAREWARLWSESDVVVVEYPNYGNEDEEEEEEANGSFTLQQRLRYCTYVMLSHVRPESDAQTAVVAYRSSERPAECPECPDLASFAELAWFVPGLVVTRPESAALFIEREYARFATSVITSANYEIDCSGRDSPSSSPSSFSSLTARVSLLGINAWNCFRSTTDETWLSEKGYRIVADTADYVAARILTRENERVGLLEGVLEVLLLRYATDAARVLGRNARNRFHTDLWTRGIDVVLREDVAPLVTWRENDTGHHNDGIFRPWSNYEKEDSIEVAEPLATLVPLFSGVVAPDHHSDDGHRAAYDDAIIQNSTYYDQVARLRSNGQRHPYTLAWECMLEGVRMLRDVKRADVASARLDDLARALTSDGGVWGNMRLDADLTEVHSSFTEDADPSACSVFVYTFLTSICAIRTEGEFVPDGVLRRPFGTNPSKEGATVLPSTIREIRLQRSGGSGRHAPRVLINNAKI